MKLLLAWELGDHYGHILRLHAVARCLRERGHTVVFAIRQTSVAHRVTGDDWTYLSAPALPFALRPIGRPLGSFADILAARGFLVPEGLTFLVTAWETMFREVQPDAVLLDHAPAALFAARLCGIPTVQIGTGFECPPACSPYPAFRPEVSMAVLAQTEASILANLNRLWMAANRPPLETVAEGLTADRQLLLTFDTLDHYPERKDADYLGSLFEIDAGIDAAWSGRHGQRILAYLHPHAQLALVLEGLHRASAEVIVVAPGIAPELRAQFADARFAIRDEPVRLAGLLGQCDVAVTHGGHGLASACLLHGVPLLTVPVQMEQWLLSQRIERAGMGLTVSPNNINTSFGFCLEALLSRPSFRLKAQQWAKEHSGFERQAVLACVADAVEQVSRFAG